MTPFTEATAAAENPRAKAGGNKPPIAEFYREQNDTLPGYLAEDNAEIAARVAELQAAFTRAPAAVTNDDLAGKVADFIAQVAKCAKQAEAKRVDAKAGPLTAGRLIDGYFQKQILEKLDAIKKPLTDRLTAFERIKAAEERKRREEAEAVARAEAQRLAREAEAAAARLDTAEDLDAAIAAEDAAAAQRAEAAKALEAATAKAADMSKVVGDYGSSSSLRTTWVARIEDENAIDLSLLRGFLSTDSIQKALNAYVRIHKDKKPMKGVSFAEETTAVVRG